MSVVLNGNTYQASDFVGADGRGYAETFAATGLQLFPESIFTDLIAELASATSIDGVSPGAAGGILVSDGSDWVRAAGATITDAGAASFTTGAFSGALTLVSNIFNSVDDGDLIISGGDSQVKGGNVLMFGSTHATLAGVTRIRDNTTTVASFSSGATILTGTLSVTTSLSSAFPNTVSGTGLMVTTNDDSVQEIMRDSSSARFKTDIEDAVIDPAKVLGINAKEYGRPGQEGRTMGFIVEDFHEAGFGDILSYDKEGPAGFLDFGRGITALHHVVLQSHEERIAELEAEIELLKAA